MKKRLLLVLFLFTTALVFSQHETLQSKNLSNSTFSSSVSKAREFAPNGVVKCATVEYSKSKQVKGVAPSDDVFEAWLAPRIEEIKRKRLAGKLPAVIRIPVVVHVIHNGDVIGAAGGENIRDSQVISQITVFNQDFRKQSGTPGNGAGVDTTIEFCLAVVDPSGNPTTGIDRRNLGIATFDGAAVESAKATTIWDPTKYLNMWTFRFGGDLSGILGYAQFPTGSGLPGMPTEDCISGEASTDGVVCAYNTWGSSALSAGEYSAPYDKGRTMTHEVGHMFGLRHTWGDGDCTVDDFCADTPNCNADFYAGFPTCTAPTECGNRRQIENYMDYSDDGCMNIFTQNQKDRMLAVLENSPRRDDLLVSTVCNLPQASIQYKRQVCESRVQNSKKTEGNGCSFTDYTVALNINKAPTANATVTFSVDAASTASSNDFMIVTPTVTFNSGSTTDQNLVVRVYNDDYVESNESIIINFTVNANGGDAFAHAEGNKLTFTILNEDAVPSTTVISTLISEDFEDAADWSLYDVNADTWGIVNGAAGIGTAPNTIVGKCAYSEKSRTYLGGTGSATPNNYFISPQVTIPTGANAVNLSYIIAGYGATAGNYTVYFATNITSDVTINAGTVLQASTTIASGTSVLRSHSLMGLAGQTGYIVYRHSNNNTATGLLLLDSVLLTATFNTVVQTAVNTGTPDQICLNGIGADARFDNPSNSDIMFTVSVNSANNYGVTSGSVSRAGTGAMQYGASTNVVDFAMSKQFTITPTNVLNGGTTIKFYFTAAEVAGWESATGNTRSQLYAVKDGTTQEIVPVSISAFGTGVILTATFSTGVNGVYSFARQASLTSDSFELTNISLYPNPNSGSFSIQFVPSSQNTSVLVHDMRGRVIFDKKYNNNGLFNETIQLDNAQKGIYLVSIEDGARKTTKKIIIE